MSVAEIDRVISALRKQIAEIQAAEYYSLGTESYAFGAHDALLAVRDGSISEWFAEDDTDPAA